MSQGNCKLVFLRVWKKACNGSRPSWGRGVVSLKSNRTAFTLKSDNNEKKKSHEKKNILTCSNSLGRVTSEKAFYSSVPLTVTGREAAIRHWA